MGSSGSGRFSDYSGKQNQPAGNGGSSGGGSGEDLCRQAFSAGLEDIGQYDLFSTTGNVPAPGTKLTLILSGRIVAVDQNGTSVGALPTKLNYLAGCIRNGFQYVGVVQHSAAKPVPRVDVDFLAV